MGRETYRGEGGSFPYRLSWTVRQVRYVAKVVGRALAVRLSSLPRLQGCCVR
jgi:hypothetical protein